MGNDTKTILAAKKYPSNIKSNKAFKSIDKIIKIFPTIGLANCEEEIIIDNSKEIENAARAVLYDIRTQLQHRLNKLQAFGKKKTAPKAKKMAAERVGKFERCCKILTNLHTMLDKKDVIRKADDGRYTFNLINNIKIGEEIILKSGERLTGAYSKINKMLQDGHFLPMTELDKLPAFKLFSSKNIPANKHKIVFSSDGEEGAWDIATMSMRGVESCQSWGQGNATHIIGSMIDPFTGIIYLTSGAQHKEMGTKMMRRCVVRFVVNDKTKKPTLMMERMYPAFDAVISDVFKEFLERKVGKDIKVVGGHNPTATGYYVPMASTIRDLAETYRPYRDSAIQYKTDEADYLGKFREQSGSILREIASMIGTKIIASMRSMKLTGMDKKNQELFKIVRGTSSVSDVSYFVYDDLVKKAIKHLTFKHIVKSKDPYNDASNIIEGFISELDKFLAKSLKASVRSRVKALKVGDKIPAKLSDTFIDKLEDISQEVAGKVATSITDKFEKFGAKKNIVVEPEKPTYIDLLN